MIESPSQFWPGVRPVRTGINRTSTTKTWIGIHRSATAEIAYDRKIEQVQKSDDPLLAESHNYAFSLDFPGHGGSDGPLLSSIEDMADWVARALDHLGVKQAAVVGHSMGALSAISFAARHPDKARALGLVGAALAMPVSKDLLGAAASDHHDAIDMVNLWGHGFHAGIGGCEWPGVWMTGASEDLLERADKGVLANDLAACNAHQAVADNAAKITCPALVVQGSRDMMTPLKGARALAAAMPKGSIQIVQGAGHMVMIERATETLEALAGAM